MYMNNVHENITVKQDDVMSLSVYILNVISAHIINIVSSILFKVYYFLRLYLFCIISFSYISDLFILIHICKNQRILHKNKQMSQVKMLFTLQWIHRLQ